MSTRRKDTGKERKRGHFGADDALFGVIGIGASGRSDVSTHKHEYLANAITDEHNGADSSDDNPDPAGG